MCHDRTFEVGASGIFGGRRDIVAAPSSTYYTLLPVLHSPSGPQPYPCPCPFWVLIFTLIRKEALL